MKEAMWGVLVILLGAASIVLLVFFQNVTNTDEHNSQLLKEVTEAAMWDALDLASMSGPSGAIRIDKEKFVESFTRRYAESAQKGRNYTIEFYDVNENPPKVSVKIISKQSGNNIISGEVNDVTLTNKIDAILETPY